ncbi:OmpA family protein [Xinfangfangia sp. CPCC 101601]|uniref:OmpA family protein n=1 Tax=Pseudogemmobacter lacusdianii TaxID=3069608 RepID=A0ABU0VVC9_9RHOB|nr:OmpA family protein [Xinfangfangia sp. CPCC 101601]MDQ2065705.1 OmpA family protein [Xinfangfangia sp. CPCC 101601]
MQCRALLSATFALAASTGYLSAQTLSDDEILQRFNVQREAYTAVRTGTGATRGLSIVTVDDLNGQPAAVADAPVQPGSDGEEGSAVVIGSVESAPSGADPAGGLVAVAASDAAPTIDPNQVGLLPEALQVNVRISFDYDSSVLQADQQPTIDQMCRVMKASDIKLFRIMGHTDSAGSDDYNENLSTLRAQEVKRRLVTDCGMDPARLEAMGLGERFPFNSAEPEAAENRRVEFQAMS